MFLAVPHHGSDAAAWGKTLRSMAVMYDTNPTILRDLDYQADTGFLDSLGRDFGKILGDKKFVVQTYQETDGMIPVPSRGLVELQKV
jgi:hypothetical protein